MRLAMIPITLLSFILIPVAFPLPIAVDKDAFQVTVRLIEEVRGDRWRRDADQTSDLPDHVTFGIPFRNSSDVILSLRKVSLVPTTTSSNNRGDLLVDEETKNSSVYTDKVRHSSMIVRRESDEYILEGVFHHSGQDWNLQPLSRHARTPPTHQVSPLTSTIGDGLTISLVGDQVVRPHDAAKGDKKSVPTEEIQQAGEITEHTVEVVFVADYANYAKWDNYLEGVNVIQEMQLWYTYVSESMNIRFGGIESSEISIAIRVIHLKIMTNDTQDSFLDSVLDDGSLGGDESLDAFMAYIEGLSDGSTPARADHYMLFTGYPINSLAGIAFLRAVCGPYSYSVCTELFSPVDALLASHELGHSLGTHHDSIEGCDDSDQYIMATYMTLPTREGNIGNPWRFSPCSVKKMEDYLRIQACTLPANTRAPDILPVPKEGTRAGQNFTLDEQCALYSQNSSSVMCTALQEKEKVCELLFCLIPETPNTCVGLVPLQFSPCAPEKWCVKGRCVYINPPPPTPEKPTLASCFRSKFRTWFKCIMSVVFKG